MSIKKENLYAIHIYFPAEKNWKGKEVTQPKTESFIFAAPDVKTAIDMAAELHPFEKGVALHGTQATGHVYIDEAKLKLVK